MRIEMCFSTKMSNRMCLIITQKESGQKGAIWHFESAEWYSWVLIALSCLGAFWTPFLGFLEPGLALGHVFNSNS